MPEIEDFMGDYDDNGDPIYECWQCAGTGAIAGCFEDTCCGLDCDPEDPEFCCAPSRCDNCGGKGSYAVKEPASVNDRPEKGE